MKYLRISNQGSLHRLHLQLLGSSTKRDKMTENWTIGNKGSGSKLAVVAALRLDISLGVTSWDASGSYFLEYDTDPITIDGVVSHRVHYHFYINDGADTDKPKRLRIPSDMMLEAFPDWDKPIGADDKKTFKLLREYVCNAYDEDKNFKCEVTEKRYFGLEGRTSVYLEYTEEFRRILEAPERYFKFLSRHQAYAVVEGIGEIWPKSDATSTRLFLLGVLADCDKSAQRSSAFDYSLYDKTMLSEERILKSSSKYATGVGNLLAKLDDAELCASVLRGISNGEAKFEERALGFVSGAKLTPEARVAWLRAVREVFGEKVALPSPNNEVANSDAVQMYGYVLLRQGSYEFQLFLKKLGVPNADDVFPKNPEDRVEMVRFGNFDEASQKRFMNAWGLFAKRYPDRTQYPIYFFHPLDEAMRRMLGFAGHGDCVFKEVWIQATTPTTLPSVESLLVTLIHESRHCKTGLYDHQRGLMEVAEQDLLIEILRQEMATRLSPDDLTEHFGYAKVIDPIFGDPASKTAPVVGDLPSEDRTKDKLPSGGAFDEIDVDVDLGPDAILDWVNAMLKKK